MLNQIQDHIKSGEDYIFGWIVDQNGESLGSNCLIKNGNNRIEVHVPFADSCEEIKAWFVDIGLDYEPLRNSYKIPEIIWVRGVDKCDYALINSRVVHVSKRGFCGPQAVGEGVLLPQYIVEGRIGQNYICLNSVRSVYPELLNWTRIFSLETNIELDPKNSTIQSYNASFERKEPFLISQDKLIKSFVPYGTFKQDGSPKLAVRVGQEVAFETCSNEAIAFSVHMKTHCRLRNLLSILSWQGVLLDEMKVKCENDRIRKYDGSLLNPSFCDVISDNYNTWTKSKKSRNDFFFYFENIGEEGLNRWFELCEKTSKCTDELYYIAANYKHIPIESKVIEYGILFEELSKSINPMGEGQSVERKVLEVIEDLGLLAGLIPANTNNKKVARDIASTYNSLKHSKPNRHGKPREYWIDSLNLINVCEISRYIMLLWVANKLGCLRENVNNWPMDNELVERAFREVNRMDFRLD